MKARRVKRLDPAGKLRPNAARIVAVRAGELVELAARAIEHDDPHTLHDARIAAKRLRYVLEATAFCFSPDAGVVADEMRELQDLLGDIHDCDMLAPRIAAHTAELRDEDGRAVAEAVAESAAAKAGRAGGAAAGDLPWRAVMRAPNHRSYAGLAKLELYVAARRASTYDRFVKFWTALDPDSLVERLKRATSARPDSTS